MSITSQICQLLKLPSRLENVAASYLGSLMRDVSRHTLSFASKISGLAVSQFSRLLSDHKELAMQSLNRTTRRRLDRLFIKRKALVAGAPWRVAIIVDATLHERSSRHLENGQRFNHGDGWVTGHQWTNIVLVINGHVIPIAPLAFLTKQYCRKLGVKYKTEHERIIDFLAQWDLEKLLPGVEPKEIVFLMDAGYDCKELQTFITSEGWSFVGSLKKIRGVHTEAQNSQSVEILFQNTRKIGPWQTIRMNSGNQRKEFRIRTLTGELKGVSSSIRLVCSEKTGGGKRYLACSNEKISAGTISRAYALRWLVEIFHKDIKSYLGFQDPGLTSFQALHSHVLWVYCAYLLLFELTESEDRQLSLFGRKKQIENQSQLDEIGKVLKLNGRYDSKKAIQNHYSQVKKRLNAA